MSATIDFYLAQAEKCTAEAGTSQLTQVRDRNLRAAAAWQAMADKLLPHRNAAPKRKARGGGASRGWFGERLTCGCLGWTGAFARAGLPLRAGMA
jgi:hypothetical protein